MKVWILTALIAISACGFCSSETCTKFRIRKHRRPSSENNLIYRIGLKKEDSDTFTFKLKVAHASNTDVNVSTWYGNFLQKNGNEYKFELNTYGKGLLNRVRGSVPCRFVFITVHLRSSQSNYPTPELSELHFGSFNCTVPSTQCPQRSETCKKYQKPARRYWERKRGLRYLRLPEPKLIYSELTVSRFF
jgi:hypothetical protein